MGFFPQLISRAALLLLLLPTAIVVHGADCMSGLKKFDPDMHKKVYYVGVHAPGGIETAWKEHNITFEQYLTATAGQRFDPPIEFKMITTTAPLYDWIDGGAEEDIDFYYSDTGVYSCVGTEIGAQPVVTTVAEFKVRGHHFELDMFAGA